MENIKERRYLTRIISLFLVFMVVLMVPFSILVYNHSVRSLSESIRDSNDLFLQQMRHDYLLFKENASSLCLSAYYRDEVQYLMYANSPTRTDGYHTMQTLWADIITTQSSLHSIEIYNVRSNTLFSTADMISLGVSADTSLLDYLADNPDIKKLEPVLRKVPVNGASYAELYVFSYFMFENSGSSVMDSSFIVVNQDANWFVESLTQVRKSAYASSVFLASADGRMINYSSREIAPGDGSVESNLVSECVQKISSGELPYEYGSYVSDLMKEKYLISWLNTEEHGDVLILVQDYNRVFGTLNSLSHGFVLLVGIFMVIGLASTWILSRSLYRPLNDLCSYVDGQNALDMLEGSPSDEFTRLQAYIERSADMNQRLLKQKSASEDVLRRLMLFSLLQKNNETSWKKYKSILQDAPLSTQQHWRLAVVLVEVEHIESNEYGFLETEESVIHYAIYNIFAELVEQGLVEHLRRHEGESIFIVNLAQQEDRNLSQILDVLLMMVKDNLGIRITISYSGIGESVHQLPDLYQEALGCMQYRPIYDQAQILDVELCRSNENNPAYSYTMELETDLMSAIRTRKLDDALCAIDQIRLEIKGLKYEYVTLSLIELLTRLRSCFLEVDGDVGKEVIANYLSLFDMIRSRVSLDSIFDEIKRYIQTVVENRSSLSGTEARPEITEKVIQYIEENYNDVQLSVQTIADHVGMSTRNISRLFRRSMDVTINEYIQSYRLQKAAEMLITTDLAVDLVADRIGISSKSYFYHLFRKQFGCTPREFSQAKQLVKDDI